MSRVDRVDDRGGVVKTRMKSVENIKKITSAMKMVAASKMRTAKTRTMQSRGIIKPLVRLLGDMPGTLIYLILLHMYSSHRGG